MDLAEVAGTSTSTPGFAPTAAARLDARSNFDLALESFQDIQLPSSEAPEGGLIRHLTHPSQIRKRSIAAKSDKRKWQGSGEGATRKKKRKCQDQVDVFDHLATLHRKQRAQMEMKEVADSQEVPSSPQIGPTPCDYPSLHSTQFLSDENEPCRPPPKAKRVLFDVDGSEEGERGFPTAIGSLVPWEGREPYAAVPFADRNDVISEAHSSTASLDQALEHHNSLQAQAALVPVLTVPCSSVPSPHFTAPPGYVLRQQPRPHLLIADANSVLKPHLTARPRPYLPSLRPHLPSLRPHLTTPVLRPHLTADFTRHPTSGSGQRPHSTAGSGQRPRPTAGSGQRPLPTAGSGLRLPPGTVLGNLLPSSSNIDPEPLDVRNFSILRYYPREE